jgi:vitamin K-dependent gamma-carboxylase
MTSLAVGRTVHEQSSRPVDIAWLAAFRVLFGLTMCFSMLRFVGYGWVDSFFVRPSFHFKYWGFAWVEPLSAPLMHGLFWSLAALALCIALGLCFRVAAPLFTVGFTYLQLVDVTNYLNHYYLASLLGLLLSVSPAHRAYSLDATIKPGLRATHVPVAWLWLFRFQVAIVYTFAGLAKAYGDWLLYAQPLQIWLHARTDTPVIGPLFAHLPVVYAMSWAGFLFDTTIPWLLMVRRVRPYAYALVLLFHFLTRLLFPIGMFPVIMVLAALLFFSPSWPRGLLGKLRGDASKPPTHAPSGALTRPALSLLALYCAVQLLVPLRFLAYGGDVRWHEQGMRFSWRVMVREKNGSVTFRVRDAEKGKSFLVAPGRFLTRLQEREMSSQPDLILQFAHFLRDHYRAKGLGAVEVYAEALVSLNGRPMAPMIDPHANLASIDDGVRRATWILPAPDEPPPSLRPLAQSTWSRAL